MKDLDQHEVQASVEYLRLACADLRAKLADRNPPRTPAAGLDIVETCERLQEHFQALIAIRDGRADATTPTGPATQATAPSTTPKATTTPAAANPGRKPSLTELCLASRKVDPATPPRLEGESWTQFALRVKAQREAQTTN